MPSVICPGCGRRIELSEEDTALESIICARCERLFSPGEHSAGTLSAPAARVKVAGLIVAGLVFVGVLGLLLLLFSRPAAGRRGLTPESDPYAPDCAIVRGWLRQRYGDVEVVSWGSRSVQRHAQADDHATLSVRFRKKGERQTCSGFFVIGPGDIVESAQISD